MYSALLTSGRPKRFTTSPHINPFTHTHSPIHAHTFTHLGGGDRVRGRPAGLAPGHLHNHLGGAGDRTSDPLVTGPPAVTRRPPPRERAPTARRRKACSSPGLFLPPLRGFESSATATERCELAY